MASTTLTVTVNGGVPPTTIQVHFFSAAGHILDLGSPKSFSHTFADLAPGTYDMFITGMNPAGGNTVCSLSSDPNIRLNPPDPSPITVTGNYTVSFHFKVS